MVKFSILLSSVLFLMIGTCRTWWPYLGLSLCHLEPCLPQLVPVMHEGVVVSLLYLWWRSPVFPNNTKSQASQVLASFPETSMVNVMGCYQIPLDLQSYFVHLVVWGCGPQSGYWFQASDHLGHSIWQPLTQKQWLWIETMDKFIEFRCKGPCNLGDPFIHHQWIPSQTWRHFLPGKRY